MNYLIIRRDFEFIFRWTYFQTLCRGRRDVILIDVHDFEALEYDRIMALTLDLAVDLTTTMDKMMPTNKSDRAFQAMNFNLLMVSNFV